MSATFWLTTGFVLVELATRGLVTRRVLSAVSVSFIVFELAVVRLYRLVVRPRYAVIGECQRCGSCCRSIIADPPRLIKATPPLLQLFAAFHRVAHNFSVVGRGPNGELVFACGYVQTDERCGIYWRRPFICRNYPLVPYYEAPQLLPECSYRVVHASLAHRTLAPRGTLPILDPYVAVHHPTPMGKGPAQPEHFELVAASKAEST